MILLLGKMYWSDVSPSRRVSKRDRRGDTQRGSVKRPLDWRCCGGHTFPCDQSMPGDDFTRATTFPRVGVVVCERVPGARLTFCPLPLRRGGRVGPPLGIISVLCCGGRALQSLPTALLRALSGGRRRAAGAPVACPNPPPPPTETPTVRLARRLGRRAGTAALAVGWGVCQWSGGVKPGEAVEFGRRPTRCTGDPPTAV